MVVIGAGLGGLAAAARLAHAGFDVRVVEKERGPGGRCSTLTDGPFRWDIGPTILLFPHVLRQLFADCDAPIETYLELSVCDPNYRIHYRDGSQLTMSANLRHMQEELERFAPGSFKGFLELLDVGRVAKETAFGTFLSRTFDRKRDMFTPRALWGVLRSQSHRSLYSVVSERVSDERLRMALTFQTMYLGLSPYDAPALFGLLPYTELADGVWYAKAASGPSPWLWPRPSPRWRASLASRAPRPPSRASWSQSLRLSSRRWVATRSAPPPSATGLLWTYPTFVAPLAIALALAAVVDLRWAVACALLTALRVVLGVTLLRGPYRGRASWVALFALPLADGVLCLAAARAAFRTSVEWSGRTYRLGPGGRIVAVQ